MRKIGMIYASTKKHVLAEACIDGANRAIFPLRQRQQHAMTMNLDIGKERAVRVNFWPRGIVGENCCRQINLFADKPILAAAGIDRFLVEHFQRGAHCVELVVGDSPGRQ